MKDYSGCAAIAAENWLGTVSIQQIAYRVGITSEAISLQHIIYSNLHTPFSALNF